MFEDCNLGVKIHTERAKVFSGNLWLGVEIYTERTKMRGRVDLH